MEDLFNNYQKKRNIDLSLEQFVLLLEFFPMLLVAISDGKIDDEEKAYLKKLARNAASFFKDEGFSEGKLKAIEEVYTQEMYYLIENHEFWQKDFLKALCKHLKEFPSEKHIIADTLYLLAEVSEDISYEEKDMIEMLKQKLQIS